MCVDTCTWLDIARVRRAGRDGIGVLASTFSNLGCLV